MRTNLNSTSMRNTCPEFPLFGANYPVNYLFFRDMGNLGEGCLISAFIWLIIMLAIIGVFCLY